MNNQNNAKKKKLPFNVIDILIVLIIIALGFGAIARTKLRSSTADAQNVKAVITFKMSDVSKESADKIKVGTVLYQNTDSRLIGTVISADEPVLYEEYIEGEDGKLVLSTYNGEDENADAIQNARYSKTFAVECYGSDTAGAYSIGGVRYVAPNALLDLISLDSEFSATILSIEIKN
ncbi:MAG: hypothetical protein J5922_00495 [Clostridia bacterium]|nr:hypothetical protein [Clostridia bacterium]